MFYVGLMSDDSNLKIHPCKKLEINKFQIIKKI